MTDEKPKAQDEKAKPKPLKGSILRDKGPGGVKLDEDARAQGFIGDSPKKHAREAYSMESGPNAPTGERGPE